MIIRDKFKIIIINLKNSPPKPTIKINLVLIKILTQEVFIKKSKDIHGDKYDYHKVVYLNSAAKMKIWCNTCQEFFFQTLDSHTSKRRPSGCPDCALKRKTINQQEAIKRCITIIKY